MANATVIAEFQSILLSCMRAGMHSSLYWRAQRALLRFTCIFSARRKLVFRSKTFRSRASAPFLQEMRSYLGPFLRKSKWVDSAKLMRLRPADSAKLPRLRSACCTKIQSPCNMQTTPTQQSALEFYSLIILWVMNSEFCM